MLTWSRIVLVALALMVSATAAAAADEPDWSYQGGEPSTQPVDQSVAREATKARLWLERTLHAPVPRPDRALEWGSQLEATGDYGQRLATDAWTTHTRVVYSKRIHEDIRLVARGKCGYRAVRGVNAMLHEWLHRDLQGWSEEGITDALSTQMTQAYYARKCGRRGIVVALNNEVRTKVGQWAQVASARITGKPRHSYAARRELARAWGLSQEGRTAWEAKAASLAP